MTTALRRHSFPKDRRESARIIAADILSELSTIFPTLQRLCQRTCPWCPDPCCLNARLWFDAKDILFLHFTDQVIPGRQPCSHRNQACSFLGHKGCRLPRLSRPFMCTWYVCPTQKAILAKDSDLPVEDVRKGIERIKNLRKQLASESGAEAIFFYQAALTIRLRILRVCLWNGNAITFHSFLVLQGMVPTDHPFYFEQNSRSP